MKIYNENKTEELNYEDIDLNSGHLINDVLVIHHEKIESVNEEGHYETVKEYDNGGKDIEWVVDVYPVEEMEAYDEQIDIQVYKQYTNEEKIKIEKEKNLYDLKKELADTDYQAIKYAEGCFTEDEYQPIREFRESLREQIRLIIDQ